MNDSRVSLAEILAAASGRSASLVPETAGYLALAIADAASRMPLLFDQRDVILTVDGDVALLSRGQVVSSSEGARLLRATLAELLTVSIGSLSGLSSASRPRSDGARGVDDVAIEIESALIPINRAAARRALARLARETLRAKASGAAKLVSGSAPPPARSSPPPPARSSPPPPARSSPPPARSSPPPAPLYSSPPSTFEPPAPARPPSPGERRLEALREKRSRTRGWAVPSIPDGSSLSAVIAAPLKLPKLPPPPRLPSIPAAAATPPRGAFVRPLAVIPRPVLRSCGAPNELRIGPGGVGEIWAPSSAVGVTGRITEPAAIAESEELPVLALSESEGSPVLALSIREEPSEPAPSIDLEPLDDNNISAMTTAVFAAPVVEVILFEDPALLMENEPMPLIDVEIIEPMDATHETATPTIAMPVLDELSERTFLTETPHILRVTLPWPSSWKYQPPAFPPAPARASATTPALFGAIEPVAAPPEPLVAAMDPVPVAAIPAVSLPGAPPELAPGIARADELLLRFGASADTDAAVRAAAKSLRALAGVDLTPSIALSSVAPVAPSSSGSAPSEPLESADSIDDHTPPATSPAPISAPIRRPFRGHFLLSAAAFAGGIAAATLLVHLRPDFPDGVVSLVAGALPARPSPLRWPPIDPAFGEGNEPGANVGSAPDSKVDGQRVAAPRGAAPAGAAEPPLEQQVEQPAGVEQPSP